MTIKPSNLEAADWKKDNVEKTRETEDRVQGVEMHYIVSVMPKGSGGVITSPPDCTLTCNKRNSQVYAKNGETTK